MVLKITSNTHTENKPFKNMPTNQNYEEKAHRYIDDGKIDNAQTTKTLLEDKVNQIDHQVRQQKNNEHN